MNLCKVNVISKYRWCSSCEIYRRRSTITALRREYCHSFLIFSLKSLNLISFISSLHLHICYHSGDLRGYYTIGSLPNAKCVISFSRLIRSPEMKWMEGAVHTGGNSFKAGRRCCFLRSLSLHAFQIFAVWICYWYKNSYRIWIVF